MNEGHAGFLGVERIRELIDGRARLRHRAGRGALAHGLHHPHPGARRYRPVPGGDGASTTSASRSRGAPSSRLLPGVPLDRILAFGGEDDPSKFNMAHMGLRLAQRANGVSLLHGRSAAECSTSCGRDSTRPRCRSGRSPTVCTRPPGPRRNGWSSAANWPAADSLSEPAVWERLQQVDPGHLWWIRSQLREALVEDVRAPGAALVAGARRVGGRTGLDRNGFDPDVLTIGFARRVPTYKRLTLMLRDPERLERLLLDEKRPIQLIVAGKSHPADDGGKALIQQVVRFADRPEVRHRIAFLPDYDMSMARQLYWGCDVWLNNPLRPLEACGTSGMKSALNGGLNLSIRDGWWDEWYDGENGWEIPTADGLADEDAARRSRGHRAVRPARAVGAPKFYDRDEHGVPTPLGRDGAPHAAGARARRCWPRGWCATTPRSTTLRRHSRCAGPSSRATVDGDRSAPPVSWPITAAAPSEAWPKIQITDVDSYGLPDTPLLGSELTLTATVDLAGLRPDEVAVQAVLGPRRRR